MSIIERFHCTIICMYTKCTHIVFCTVYTHTCLYSMSQTPSSLQCITCLYCTPCHIPSPVQSVTYVPVSVHCVTHHRLYSLSHTYLYLYTVSHTIACTVCHIRTCICTLCHTPSPVQSVTYVPVYVHCVTDHHLYSGDCMIHNCKKCNGRFPCVSVCTVHLVHALVVEPGFYSTNWLFLGKTYLRLGEKEKAREWLEKTVAFDGPCVGDVEDIKVCVCFVLVCVCFVLL